MDKILAEQCQESLDEWAEIEKTEAERRKKDNRIVSNYCAENKEADIIHILELLDKHKGAMPKHDEIIVDTFKHNYPKTLTVKMIVEFEDIKDIYSEYLEMGDEK